MPDGYYTNWTAVVLAGGIGTALIVTIFILSKILSPRRPSLIKTSPYECGIPASPHKWSQLRTRYYIFAILFLIFDVEAAFLFPWGVIFLESIDAVFYEMLIFIGILFFGIIYGWRKGVLQWK